LPRLPRSPSSINLATLAITRFSQRFTLSAVQQMAQIVKR
jgi:hypothetical protein